MTAHRPDTGRKRFDHPTPAETRSPSDHEHGHRRGHHGHGLMMLLMCLPMLAIVGFLVLTGGAGSGAFLGAFLCMGVMMLMMYAMPRGGGRK